MTPDKQVERVAEVIAEEEGMWQEVPAHIKRIYLRIAKRLQKAGLLREGGGKRPKGGRGTN